MSHWCLFVWWKRTYALWDGGGTLTGSLKLIQGFPNAYFIRWRTGRRTRRWHALQMTIKITCWIVRRFSFYACSERVTGPLLGDPIPATYFWGRHGIQSWIKQRRSSQPMKWWILSLSVFEPAEFLAPGNARFWLVRCNKSLPARTIGHGRPAYFDRMCLYCKREPGLGQARRHPTEGSTSDDRECLREKSEAERAWFCPL